MEVLAVPGEPTGIKQKVYLPVYRELLYRGSLYVKHLSGPDTIDISLRRRDRPEEFFAHATIHADASDWTKYTFSLSVPPEILLPLEPADLVFQLEGDERILLDQASLFPADALDGLDPEIVTLAKDMHTPPVRFGGNFTSGYHWRDGIGPMDKRINMLNIACGIPEYNQFGTDEFPNLCDLIDAEPQIALNLGSGTPQEAADWVGYVDETGRSTADSFGNWGTSSGATGTSVIPLWRSCPSVRLTSARRFGR